jgi:hypothetical protein
MQQEVVKTCSKSRYAYNELLFLSLHLPDEVGVHDASTAPTTDNRPAADARAQSGRLILELSDGSLL